MGQKVNPIGWRVGYLYEHHSKWFEKKKKDYSDNLIEDLKIKKWIKERFFHTAISKILTERKSNRLRIIIKTARPGIIIGKGGETIEKLRQDIKKMVGEKEVTIDIFEIENPYQDAQLLAEAMARKIEKRVPFRRVMKQAIFMAKNAGVLGVKVYTKGRLQGVEIARKEWYHEGRMPLQTLRAEIDYGFAEAYTKYGKIGVKVWLFKGEKFVKDHVNA